MSRPPRSATETAGERFAAAVAAQDSARLRATLADEIDFQALTPGAHWQAAAGREVADDIVLGRWFAPGREIRELCAVTTGRVADCEHVAYRLRVRKDGRDYLVEQQAYYRADDGRISWLRMLCSGYREAGPGSK
jgi:ketosteroid isomerase-like protein